MMGEGFYLLAGFALLITLPAFFIPDRRVKDTVRKSWKEVFGEGTELFWQTALLTVLYLIFVEILFFPMSSKEALGVVLFPSAYALARLRRRPDPFFVISFALTFFILQEESEFNFFLRLFRAAELAYGIALLKWLLIGLNLRLAFSSVPKPLRGLPVWLVTAAVLILAFTGIQSVLP